MEEISRIEYFKNVRLKNPQVEIENFYYKKYNCVHLFVFIYLKAYKTLHHV